MNKWGVFLARLQPLHNGHVALIKKMLEENDNGLILIGSSDKINKRNPIPGAYRKELLENTLKDLGLKDRVRVVLLPDLTSEEDNSHDWGFYLYSNVVKEIGRHDFTMYYSDGWEIITKWFPGFILQNSVDLRLIARNNCEEGISATKVRSMIINDDINLNDVVPNEVYINRNIIKSFINVWS